MENNDDSHYLMGYRVNSTWTEILIFHVMKCYINPIISVLGLAANTFSVVILCRSGLDKPTSILLLSLAVSDSMCMFSTLDIPFILTYFDIHKKYPLINGWQYDYYMAYFLYLIDSTMTVIGYWGCYVNTAIPVLITIERLCAIFWPMTFKRFITKQFALAIVTMTFTFWLPINLICQVNIHFEYVNISTTDFMGTLVFTDYFQGQDYFISLYAFEILSSWIPITIVSFGCVVIWIKLKSTLTKRRVLTNSNSKWSPKTTRTLLSTCLMFSITHISYSIIVFVYSLDFINLHINFNQYEFLALIYIVNNSSIFFLYIAFNNKFRVILRDILKKPRFT